MRPKYKEKLKEKNWSHTGSVWYLNSPWAFSPERRKRCRIQCLVDISQQAKALCQWDKVAASFHRWRNRKPTALTRRGQKSPWFWASSTNRPQGHPAEHAGQILRQEKLFDSEQDTPRRVCVFLSSKQSFQEAPGDHRGQRLTTSMWAWKACLDQKDGKVDPLWLVFKVFSWLCLC